ncbi:unnamed protein product [Lactuca saligna]|uniref:Uncharacterized protein n=1 Tax=Lactuca saligna TaxID=75948 RepID=A0AA35YUC9_LACSI|nr:unnamed protein product [Lactuca saligna]
MKSVPFYSLSSHRSIHCRLTPTSGLNPRIKSTTLDSSSTTIIDDPTSASASEEESPAKIGARVRVKVPLMSLFRFNFVCMPQTSSAVALWPVKLDLLIDPHLENIEAEKTTRNRSKGKDIDNLVI